MERFFGGNPVSVAITLVVVCIIVGIVLAALGINPADLLAGIPDLIRAITQFGWGWVDTLFHWFVLGAIIVLPIWFIIRVLKYIGGDNGRPSRS